jgi:hypothetical protein
MTIEEGCALVEVRHSDEITFGFAGRAQGEFTIRRVFE